MGEYFYYKIPYEYLDCLVESSSWSAFPIYLGSFFHSLARGNKLEHSDTGRLPRYKYQQHYRYNLQHTTVSINLYTSSDTYSELNQIKQIKIDF